jgi:hypothetical protein
MPALPLDDAGPYVAAAYLVFLALILVYVGIMASKLVRIERQAAELNELAARREPRSVEGGGDGPHVGGAPHAGPQSVEGGGDGPHVGGAPQASRPAEPAERP